MNCNTCKNKSFCKHYDYFNNLFDLVITVNKCKYYINELILEQEMFPKLIKNNQNIKTQNDIKVEDRFIDETDKSNITDFKLVKTPTQLEKCPNCQIKTYKEDIQNCSICGKTICSNCGSTNLDINTKKKSLICHNCFSINNADFNNAETVDITIKDNESEIDTKEPLEEIFDVEKKTTRNKKSNSESKTNKYKR